MKSSVHRYWKYGAIILALCFAGAALENWQIQKTLDGIYRYDGKVGVSGIAYKPRQWSFGRDGYRGAPIIVDEDTEPSLTVKLEPI